MTKPIRCAIYTRKSTEEGLEQAFNSLHAQREACEAYVLSQAGEGWSALSTPYDDGGFSGGNIERPALKALMADIAARRIDVVVVYKVDRLTRSLADFAKIIELFDQHQVSFVSVTQAFNTTSSMGRLTLNVLLSFAQFEREVTGERIRDKIAASKAKGLRMGGRPPLGYDVRELRLVVNPAEAETVRHIFGRYLAMGSVPDLVDELDAQGIRSKRWIMRNGKEVGSVKLTQGPLYYLLCNPVYRGANRHKDKVYEATHPPIIDEATWAAVQAMLHANGPNGSALESVGADAPLLRGLIHDDQGHPMQVLHTRRAAKRYRYYASTTLQRRGKAKGAPGSLPRIAVGAIDAFVKDQVLPGLSRGWMANEAAELRVREALVKLTLGEDRVVLTLKRAAVAAQGDQLGGAITSNDGEVVATLPIQLKHRHRAVLIQAPGHRDEAGSIDRALVRAVVLARTWAGRLECGEAASLKALAKAEGYCQNYAMRLLPLAWLAPDLVERILEGRQPASMQLSKLIGQPLPAAWDEQRRLFAKT